MGSRPKVVKSDPEGDARIAAEQATLKANAEAALRKARKSRDTLTSALGSVDNGKQSVLGMAGKQNG